MNPNNQPQQNPVQPPPDWFSDNNNKPELSSSGKPQPRKYLFVLAGIVAAAIFITGGILLFLNFTTLKCLTPADYQTITGQALEDSLSPVENFYTGSVIFKEKSSEYSSNDHLKVIEKLGEFQSSNSRTSIKVTLTASYSPDEGKILAENRLQKLKVSFLDAGINEESITLEEPQEYIPESDVTVSSTPIQYSVTSVGECK